jgi:PilZ domain
VTADAGEIKYYVLLDRAAPYLLARVRWPDVAQAITAGNPDWLDDIGLFDLPYDPTAVTVSFTQAASVAAGWGRQLHAEPARDVPSFIRRMPSNWSDITPVERQALGLDSARRRRVSARSLRRLRSTRAKIAAAAQAGGFPDAFADGSSAVSFAEPADHGHGRNQAAGLPMASTAADETTLVDMRPASTEMHDPTLTDMRPASTEMHDPTLTDMRRASAALDDMTLIDMIRADETTGWASGATERRSHVRLPVDGRAHIRWGKTTISAGLVDLSEGGARCVLPEAPPLLARGATLGGPFLLEAEVATSRICLDVAARIAWHRSVRAGAHFGVVFGELDESETDGMQGFLAAAAAGRRGAR